MERRGGAREVLNYRLWKGQNGENKTHNLSSPHGEGIWGLSWVRTVDEEDQTERKVAYCLFHS